MAASSTRPARAMRNNSKYKLKPTNMGVFVGYTLPVLLRIYGVYSFRRQARPHARRVTDNYGEGTAVKVGIGITSLYFVAINVEYMTITFGKINNAPRPAQIHHRQLRF